MVLLTNITPIDSTEKNIQPWLVWLSGLSAGLWTKGSLVRFPVRAHAWVAGQIPSWGLGAWTTNSHPLPSKDTGTSLGCLQGPPWSTACGWLYCSWVCICGQERVWKSVKALVIDSSLRYSKYNLEKVQTQYRPAAGFLPLRTRDAAPDLRRKHLLFRGPLECDPGIPGKGFWMKIPVSASPVLGPCSACWLWGDLIRQW